MSLLLGLAVALLAGVSVVTVLQRRTRDAIAAMGEALAESPPGPAGAATSRTSAVPAVVQRYLELAVPPGGRPPSLVTLEQHGELRTSPTSSRWMPFTAIHVVAPQSQGFLWNARVEPLPLVHLRVLDMLVRGRGSGQVLMLSAFAVGHDDGTPQMNSGSLHRFLAEAVWYPWALLPSEQLSWSALDGNRALATLVVNGVTVALEFRFADSGEVVGIYSPGRWGSFDGGYAQVPWEGHFSGYGRRHGILVPRHGEVGWCRDGKLELVWRGSIDGFTLDPPGAPLSGVP